MQTKKEQLEKLFEKWLKARPDYKGFKKDGIVNEDFFKFPHILFLCKEPNNPKQEEGDYRKEWNENMPYAFSQRIAQWSYGIFNKFPLWTSFHDDDCLAALKCIAFMNVKKTGGGNKADYNKIGEIIKSDLEFINEEIEIINPTIIICGLGLINITRFIFSEIPTSLWKESGHEIFYAIHNGRLIIDFYHPSVPAPGVMSYVLLERIFAVISKDPDYINMLTLSREG
jgi:hypothetical protein